MRNVRSDFAFIGERDYVHAPTMFEAFRREVIAAAGPRAEAELRVRVFRVNQTMQVNGIITVAPGDAPLPEWGRPAAEMSCAAAGTSWRAGLYERDATPIGRRVAARERDFVGAVDISGPFSGAAELRGIADNDDLFQAVVEANKQVHLKTLTGDPLSRAVRFRFVYCLDYACAPSTGGGAGRVRVVTEGLRDAGEYVFSLTRLELELGTFAAAFKLCFASREREALHAAART